MRNPSKRQRYLNDGMKVCAVLASLCLCIPVGKGGQNRVGEETPSLYEFFERLESGEVPVQSIPSEKHCATIADSGEWEAAQQARKFGMDMLTQIESLSFKNIQDAMTTIDGLRAFRSWCLQTPGYGNLILAYAAEEQEVALFLSALTEVAKNGTDARGLVEENTRIAVSLDYWLQVLSQDGVGVSSEKLPPDSEPDGLRLASLFQLLWDESSTDGGFNRQPWPRRGYRQCFERFDPAQVGWLALMLSLREVALSSCLAVLENTGCLPLDERPFLVAVRQYAGDILRQEDRLGGRMFGDQVWMVWKEALDKVP